jgi:hypothetical protein
LRLSLGRLELVCSLIRVLSGWVVVQILDRGFGI